MKYLISRVLGHGAYGGTSQAAMTDGGWMETVVEWDRKMGPGSTLQMFTHLCALYDQSEVVIEHIIFK